MDYSYPPKLTVVLLGSQQDLKCSVETSLLKGPDGAMVWRGQCVKKENNDFNIVNTPSILSGSDISDLKSLSAPGPHVFLLVLAKEEQPEQELDRWEKYFPNMYHYTIVIMDKKKRGKDRKMAGNLLDISDREIQENCKSIWAKSIRYLYSFHRGMEFGSETTDAKKQRPNDDKKHGKEGTKDSRHPHPPPVTVTNGGHRDLEKVAVTSKLSDQNMFLLKVSEAPVTIQSQLGQGHDVPPLVSICLLGETGSGKSCSGNTILGSNEFLSKTGSAPVTTQCQLAATNINGNLLKVIDTPDFFDEDLKQPSRHIWQCSEMCEEGPCVYLLVIQIGRFTEGERDILEKLEQALDRNIRDRTIILFTRGDDLDQSIDSYVRKTNPYLQELIKKCGDRYQVFNNKCQGGDQVNKLMGKIAKLVQDTQQRQYIPQEKCVARFDYK